MCLIVNEEMIERGKSRGNRMRLQRSILEGWGVQNVFLNENIYFEKFFPLKKIFSGT